EEQRPIDTPTVDKLSGTDVEPESVERPTESLPISTRATRFEEAADTSVADNLEFWGTEENHAGYIQHNSNVAKPEEKQEAFWQRVKHWIDQGVPEAQVLTPMVDKAYTHVRESVTPQIPQDSTIRNSLRQEYLINNGINPAKGKTLPADFVNSKKEMIIAAFNKKRSKSPQRSESRSSISSDGSDKKSKKTQR
ncbi:MAG TPA: hypothetical protein VM532_04000, partial [Burkholderiales bacterium]|nr:hypothetical protein [Burkholderiales bacterium]